MLKLLVAMDEADARQALEELGATPEDEHQDPDVLVCTNLGPQQEATSRLGSLYDETSGCCTTASAKRSCTVFGGVGSQSAPPGPAPGKVKVRFSERNMPTLPAGYMMGPNGQAVRIPGLPPGKRMEQPG
ncbi:MAG: hypothetical protein JWM75_201 [Sphingomonas bacterium]|nr:hypothetical protein [Sphingomonas bacterium]